MSGYVERKVLLSPNPLACPLSPDGVNVPEEWDALEEDPRPQIWGAWPGAVLLDDEIRYYAEHHALIEPFNPGNLKPARYQLTLGQEAKVGRGKSPRLTRTTPW